ncbi:branched-chain-amino-acid aminotransferase, mitochondrial-like [Guaruba guarouba]
MAAALRGRGSGGGALLVRLLNPPRRSFNHVFRAEELQVELAQGAPPPPGGAPGPFGRSFTPHMLWVEWGRERGWGPPRIRPLRDLGLHPAACGLHYGIALFEGLRAFHGADGRVRLFRPELNMERMERSARRLCLPTFDRGELLECIRALVRVESAWVPRGGGASLYIRPVLLGTEAALGVAPPSQALLFALLCPAGPYFAGGALSPVRLLADPRHCRAWPGGAGDCKVAG